MRRPPPPKASPTGRLHYPPHGLVPLDGNVPVSEPDQLACTCLPDCDAPCLGDVDCAGSCEACHFLRLVRAEDAMFTALKQKGL